MNALVAPADRQLHFSYWPAIPAATLAGVADPLLQRWLQDRSTFITTRRRAPRPRGTAGALTKADRFFLAYAASALENLQSSGMAGGVVITVSRAGLTDPLLPEFVVNQLIRRAICLVGVTVTLEPDHDGCGFPKMDRAPNAWFLRLRGSRESTGGDHAKRNHCESNYVGS